MATKFKVGDKIIGKEHNGYPITNDRTVVEVIERDLARTFNPLRVRVLDGTFKGYDYWVDPNKFKFYNPPCPEKIVITSDGVTTKATRYLDDKWVSEAVATCSPEDEFDFNVGAELALERLLKSKWNIVKVKFEGGITYYNYKTTDSNVKEGMTIVVPVNYRGKTRESEVTVVEVVKGDKYTGTFPISNMTEISIAEVPKYYNGKVVCLDNDHNTSNYTVGKIYEFKDGKLKTDNGYMLPLSKSVKSFKEFTNYSSSKWLEIVE